MTRARARSGDTTITLPPGSPSLVGQYWQRYRPKTWHRMLRWACFGGVVLAAAFSPSPVQTLERQVQTLFWELRGPVAPPQDIVILAIDDESLSQGQHYLDQPDRYPELAGISAWPWQRAVYAMAVQKLIDGGARAVAIDLVFSTPSAYGPEDDQLLADQLARVGDRVVLAAKVGDLDIRQGALLQPTLPLPLFQDTPIHTGVINFIIEPDSQIHRLSGDFLDLVDQAEQQLTGLAPLDEQLPSFAEAALQAAGLGDRADDALGNHIFFYGPAGTFEQIPFWYLLDEDTWTFQLESGAYFKDKIVLIGSTATLHRDFHNTPFAQSSRYPASMSGVEVLANTVATLQEGRSLRQLPAGLAAVLVGISLVGATCLRAWAAPRRSAQRGAWVFSSAAFWVVLSYGAFTYGYWLLPTALPVLGIVSMGGIDLTAAFIGERLKKKRLRRTLARYVTSPIVQEIISQQDDLQDLLVEQADALMGKVLSDRYRLVSVLGSGGFGETYLAEDTKRPGQPICVVKQLKIISDNPKAHSLAQRLFAAEAATLEKLGEHDQIPRLLAYFEDNYAFYLVQEMVEGQLLRDRLGNYQPLSQRAVYDLLRDLLPVVQHVHQYGVIHRDIKPSNIIQRANDSRYVLIDFGAVKQITNQLTDATARMTATVGIGTQGYMPSEQSAGLPTFNSDLYALGITCIEALTGLPPHALQRDATGEILWEHKVLDLNPTLAQVITRMVRYDFNQRYATAQQALDDLAAIVAAALIEQAPPAHHKLAPTPSKELGVVDVDPTLEDTKLLPLDWVDHYAGSRKLSQQDTEADTEL